MARKVMEMGVVMVLVTMLWGLAMAQSGCTSVLIGLSPCLNYITGNATSPSSSCCSQLANVVQSQPACLCTVLNGGGATMGINVNQTRALALPGACKVQTPPASRCNAAGGPTTSPGGPSTPSDPSPATRSTPSNPSLPSIPSGGGSKTVPSAVPSDASSSVLPLPLMFFLLFAVSYASAITGFCV